MLRTLENDGVPCVPDVAKISFYLRVFEIYPWIYPACLARVICENTDLVVVKRLGWVGSEPNPVFLW